MEPQNLPKSQPYRILLGIYKTQIPPNKMMDFLTMGVGLGGKIPKPKGLNMDSSQSNHPFFEGKPPVEIPVALAFASAQGEGERSKTQLFVRGTREISRRCVRWVWETWLRDGAPIRHQL